MAKPEREFSADVGQKSMGVAGPDYIEKDFDKAFAMFDPNKNLPDGTPGGIGKENMQPGAVDDDVIGNREVDDTQAPTGNLGKYSNFLNWFAYMIKSITGKANWRTKPSYTIEQLGNSTIDGVKNIGGDIDFVADVGIEITPDAVGKKITFAAKNDAIIPGAHAVTHSSMGSDPITPESIGAETPAGAQAMVDAHENKTSTHGATAAATPNRIMMRDANGRAKVAAPLEEDDIARKAELNALKQDIENGTVVAGAASGRRRFQISGMVSKGDEVQPDMVLQRIRKRIYREEKLVLKGAFHSFGPGHGLNVAVGSKSRTIYEEEHDIDYVLAGPLEGNYNDNYIDVAFSKGGSQNPPDGASWWIEFAIERN